MNTHKNNHFGIGGCGCLRQTEAVAHIIGNVLQLAFHIKMAEDHCILFLLQPVYFIHQF